MTVEDDLPMLTRPARPDRRSWRLFALVLASLLVFLGALGVDLTEGWRWSLLWLVVVGGLLVVACLGTMWLDGWRVGYLRGLSDCRELLEDAVVETSRKDGEA